VTMRSYLFKLMRLTCLGTTTTVCALWQPVEENL
jgi:hypothetical protein